MHKLKVMSVVGARPNFTKIAPFAQQLAKHTDRIEHCLVHTGQHYSQAMSADFFDALNIPAPNVHLGIGSGSHAKQVGQTMIAFEPVVRSFAPDWIVVVGDVNATCACSITAAKENVKLAHIEAGLRSFDNTMPEEINRIVTDRLATLLFTPDEIADQNLLNEGRPESAIKRVGNIMIDTLDANRANASQLDTSQIIKAACARPVNTESGYALLTMHRPSNVDSENVLNPIVELLLDYVAKQIQLIWILHPRTRARLQQFGLMDKILSHNNVFLIEPVGYKEMLRLNMGATIMLTDSGGLQEECCILGTPCLTLRENTERPVTLTDHGGLSKLAGNNPERIKQVFDEMLTMKKHEFRPPLWDGHTSERIVNILLEMS